MATLALGSGQFVPHAMIVRLRDTNPFAAFDWACAFDPTRNGMYLQQIIHWLIDGRMRFEDGRSVRTVLTRFHADKHRLPVEQRDIARYRSPGDVLAILDPADRIVVRGISAEMLDQCDLVAQGDDWLLVRIRTTEASTSWADSTNWCTRHPETAKEYLARSPLYVLVVGAEKFQMHDPSAQVMDRYDRDVADIPNAPDPALQAAIDAMRLDYPKGVYFYNGDTAIGVLERALHSRRHGRPAVSDEDGNRSHWHSLDGRISIRLVQSENENSISIPIVMDGLHHDLHAADLNGQENLIAAPASALLHFIRSSATKLSRDRSEGSCIFVTYDSAIDQLGKAFFPECRRINLVIHDGRRYCVCCTGHPSKPMVMHIIDVDTDQAGRIHRIDGAASLNDLDSRLRHVVRIYLRDGNDADLPRLGTAVLNAVDIAELRSHAPVMAMLMERILLVEDRSILSIESVIGDLLSGGDAKIAAALMRLVSATSYTTGVVPHPDVFGRRRSIGMLTSRRSTRPPTASDLLLCNHLPLSGLLLAALPTSAVSGELVDEMIAAGRYEAVQVMPAALFTADRLVLASVGPTSARAAYERQLKRNTSGGINTRESLKMAEDRMEAVSYFGADLRVVAPRVASEASRKVLAANTCKDFDVVRHYLQHLDGSTKPQADAARAQPSM